MPVEAVRGTGFFVAPDDAVGKAAFAASMRTPLA